MTKQKRSASMKKWREKNPEYAAAWRAANREREIRNQRKWRAANADKIRVWDREQHVRRYGIKGADYDRMLADQDGLCAACGQPETLKRLGKLRRLCIDHNHETGEVRALLCATCNLALGFLRDDPERIRKLADYRDRFIERKAAVA